MVTKLAAKLAAVMQAVERIPKNGWNDFHKYHYATEGDIAEALRKELAARNVILLPAITADRRESVGEKGQVLTTLEMEFTFIDADSGESITKPWRGAGTDKEDKGCYKAMTGGEKYFLLKTFLIPTGDDPEKDDKKVQGKVKAETKAPDALPAVIPDGSSLIKKTEQLVTDADKPYWQFVLHDGEVVMTWKQQVGAFAEQACQEGKAVRLQIRGKFQEMGVVQSIAPVEPIVNRNKPNGGINTKELTAEDIHF